MKETRIARPEYVRSDSLSTAREFDLPNREKGSPRLLIGRREWISLPALGVSLINAKTDSGALSSSLHAEKIVLNHNSSQVTFITRDHFQNPIECSSPVVRSARVRSSTGHGQPRIFIRTMAKLAGGFEWEILLSLANRSVMHCPMLLGRRAMAGLFIIDPQSSNLLGNRRSFD